VANVALGGSQADLGAGSLINCTSPATDIGATADRLLRCLVGYGLARPDRLRLRLDMERRGAATAL